MPHHKEAKPCAPVASLTVNVSNGLSGDAMCRVTLPENGCVRAVKIEVEKTTGIPALACQLLYDSGFELGDDEHLKAYAIEGEVKFELVKLPHEGSVVREDIGVSIRPFSHVQVAKFCIEPSAVAASPIMQRDCVLRMFRKMFPTDDIDENLLSQCMRRETSDLLTCPSLDQMMCYPPMGCEGAEEYFPALMEDLREGVGQDEIFVHSWHVKDEDTVWCPKFAQMGLEWWGVYIFSVGNRHSGRVTVLAASTTD
eukprot:gb/GFBE01023093.1/.p1 GENE.gb/GFBE01023093.1/~~gb/GFBE01023093.1/.p1  ORF type:complete len:254 (+),score=48.73 gb/GFBE01023093.1/:1-762(+)